MRTEIDRTQRFESIADEIADPLQRYLRRRASADDADDAYSETLLAIWRRIEDVPDDAVLPWSFGVARRVLANQRRSAARRLRLVRRATATAPQQYTSGPEDAEDFPEVRAALDQLPDTDREVLTLWAWEELEPKEIAVVLDTTPNAVSLRLTRARTKLAAEIARQSSRDGGHEGFETTEEHRP